MKEKLLQRLLTLDAAERSAEAAPRRDARARIAVTLVFLVAMLSVAASLPEVVLLFFAYPVLGSAAAGISYGKLFSRSLIVLPIALMIGIFNPLTDRYPAMVIGSAVISRGWLSLLSIVMRGVLSVQAVLLLTWSAGFANFCSALQRMGVPSVLTTQLLMMYRYIFVLIDEAISMKRARDARSFGRKAYPLKVWSATVGQLLIRTVERAERIGAAMAARGFNGRITSLHGSDTVWRRGDTRHVAVWTLLIAAVRFIPFML